MPQSRKNPKRRVVPAESRRNSQETTPEWGDRMRRSGRPLPLILLAELILPAQRDIYRGFLEIRSGKLQQDQFRISPDIRRKFYLDRDAVWEALLRIFIVSKLPLTAALPESLLAKRKRLIKQWDKATPELRRRVLQCLRRTWSEDPRSIAICHEIIDAGWEEIHPAHLELLKDESLLALSENLIADPAVRFLLYYDFPCMLYFGQTSQEMFAEAATGKLSPITDLLLIDKELEFIEEIGRQTSQWRFQRDSVKLTALAEATRKSLPGKFPPRWLMYRATNFLIDLSDQWAEACFSKDSLRFTHTDLYQLLEIVCPYQPGDAGCVPQTLELFRDGLKDHKENLMSVSVWGR